MTNPEPPDEGQGIDMPDDERDDHDWIGPGLGAAPLPDGHKPFGRMGDEPKHAKKGRHPKRQRGEGLRIINKYRGHTGTWFNLNTGTSVKASLITGKYTCNYSQCIMTRIANSCEHVEFVRERDTDTTDDQDAESVSEVRAPLGRVDPPEYEKDFPFPGEEPER